jgi:PPP family 3-phenylpropionic acid transporter
LSAWYFFYFAYIGAFAPYFTLYLQSLGLGASAIGTLMSLMLAMRLLAPNFWGWLAYRLGRKTVVLRVSGLLSIAGFLFFFVASDFWALFGAMAFMSFFWSASLPLVEALTLRHLEGRSEQYGRIRLWGSVGFIVAVLGTGAWLDRAPLDSLLWVNLALLIGISACAWLLSDVPPGNVAEPRQSLRVGVMRPEVLVLLAACFFMSAAHSPFYVFYSIHLVDHGYDKSAVGLLWSLGVVAEIGVFLAMPRLMRAWSLRTILLVSFMAAVIRFLLIGWCADVVELLLLAQLMHGATFGANHAAAVAALNRWFPARQQARVQALYGSVSYGAGGMVGNMVSGAVWDWIGAGPTFTLGALFAVVGVLLLWRDRQQAP